MTEKIWECSTQWKDTPRSYEAFEVYLGLGPGRSLAKAAKKLGKSKAVLERWSKNHRWASRAEAYDFYQAQLRQRQAESIDLERHKQEIESFRSRQLSIGQAQISSSILGLQVLNQLGELTLAAKGPEKLRLATTWATVARAVPVLGDAGALLVTRSLGIEKMMEIVQKETEQNAG